MKTAIVFLIALAAATTSAFPTSGKIVGGGPVTIEEFPWQVQLQIWQFILWEFECGGSLIKEDVVLTAAHCAEGMKPDNIRIYCGSDQRSEGKIHKVKEVIVHEKYTSQGYDWDVALLKLEEPVTLSPKVGIISLARVESEAGTNATVSGWGTLKEDQNSLPRQLQAVSVPIVAREKCAEDYNDQDITENMICAGESEGGKDSCQGDSGGPLVVNNELAGVVSWGYGCARKNKPRVYSNVVALRDWIVENVEM